MNPYAEIMQGNTPTEQTSPQSGNPYAEILTPSDVSNATSLTGSQDSNGECQKFVEQMAYGHSGIYPTAVAAWNDHAKQGQAYEGTQGIKPGDIMYFAPDQSNQGAGHTGIYMGQGKFISATDNGIKPYALSDWQQMTGQQLLGYIKPQ